MQIPGGKDVPGVVVAAALMMIGAGAAAGAVGGTIGGDSSTEVDAALEVVDAAVNSADSGSVVVGDQNRSFVTSAEINQGDEFELNIDLANRASNNITAKLWFEDTGPLHVTTNADSASNISVGQVESEVFVLDVGPSAGDVQQITLEGQSGNAIAPGFYECKTRITPAELGDN